MNRSKRLDHIISELNPDIIAVEETQSDIDSLMEDVKVNSYYNKYYNDKMNTLLEEYPESNVYTLREFIQDDIWYYLRLNQSQSEGVRIFGLDDENFDHFRYAEGEQIYSERRGEFLSGVFSTIPKHARMNINVEYNAITDVRANIEDGP
ncbi:MAG: hypothetical protein KAR20_02375, partial [Candidatus Heimdallarchaeota archaeon]|nr:hypothetical protein [Candidatus Heimdallarchaeota archaeon]